jgi:hypothetical protein
LKIFVFGSNREGRHGKGAALEARIKWGARYGNPEGPQGQSYAIITKELRKDWPPVYLCEVQDGVRKFLEFARIHPGLEFHVSKIGCGLAGFTPEQIAPMFFGATPNVLLPEEFNLVLRNSNENHHSGKPLNN